MEHLLEQYQSYIDLALQYGVSYLLKIIFALLVFFIGKRIAFWLTSLADKALKTRDIDEELLGFSHSLIYWGLMALVIVASLAQLGVQTASLVALLGAAGLAIGLALQGSLSNFAAGVLIIILRPFRVGEWIDAAGESGKVRSIKIFTTELRTGDNKCVIIPNARILDSNIVNHSSTGRRRVDFVFSIGYDDDLDQAKQIILELIEADERVLDDPTPVVAVLTLAENSVDLAVRPWTRTQDYWDVYFELTESVKKSFDAAGITIPFPQRTITTLENKAPLEKRLSE